MSRLKTYAISATRVHRQPGGTVTAVLPLFYVKATDAQGAADAASVILGWFTAQAGEPGCAYEVVGANIGGSLT